MKRYDILTIFPQIVEGYFKESIMKRAQESGAVEINAHYLRDWTVDKHKTVDDTPYGGGAGMVMKVEPIHKAVEEIKSYSDAQNKRVILLSAKGKVFKQEDAKRLATYDQLIFICGRYEGVDERVSENIADEELAIGEYVLTGGELGAMVITDAIVRLLPGVLGNDESIQTESHSQEGYLEYPQYTKPEEYNGWKVPEILLSGNHKEIENWREKKSKKQK